MATLAEVWAGLRRRLFGSADGQTNAVAHMPPVDPRDFPDPFVLRTGSNYHAYATQTGDINIQVMTSGDLDTWTHQGDALPVLATWAGSGRTWAPAVLARGDTFVLFYAVREPGSDRQCISVAVADHPQGPFRDQSDEPLVFQIERGGSIDPSPFVDDDGRAYLLWKSDDNALNRPSSLWGQPLSTDGRSLLGAPTEFLRHDRAWERPLIEAPAMVRHEDRYYLFYSANWWESGDYGVGYAVAPAPLGPFHKVTRDGPWLASGAHAAGPGGQELFTSLDGTTFIAYHAWTPGAVGYGAGGARALHLVPIDFAGGRPSIERRC